MFVSRYHCVQTVLKEKIQQPSGEQTILSGTIHLVSISVPMITLVFTYKWQLTWEWLLVQLFIISYFYHYFQIRFSNGSFFSETTKSFHFYICPWHLGGRLQDSTQSARALHSETGWERLTPFRPLSTGVMGNLLAGRHWLAWVA